jgi:hypothetical protein
MTSFLTTTQEEPEAICWAPAAAVAPITAVLLEEDNKGIFNNGNNNDGTEELNHHIDFARDAIIVQNLSLKDFRSRLVVHFDEVFKRNEEEWPRRLGHCKELHSIQKL